MSNIVHQPCCLYGSITVVGEQGSVTAAQGCGVSNKEFEMPKAKDIKERVKKRAWNSGRWIETTYLIKDFGSTPELVCLEKSEIAENQAAFLAMRLIHFPEKYSA